MAIHVLKESVASLNIGKILQKIKRLHRGGILHLDLHDENIICTENGEYYIIDFGWSIDQKIWRISSRNVRTICHYRPQIWGVIDLFLYIPRLKGNIMNLLMQL